MGDLESFSVAEGSEGVDAGALDRLREQMKEAAAGMARDQKQEQKQKKVEDNLYQILLQFIDKLGPKHPLVYLIVKNMSENLLAELILAIIALNYSAIQKATGLELSDENSITIKEDALIVPNLSDQTTPLKIRIDLDIWIRFINEVVFKNPVRNLKAIKNPKYPNTAKHCVTDLMSYIAQDYLQKENVSFFGESVEKFMRLYAINLIERLEQHVNDTKQIEGNA
jgi:hypothetical protein